MQPNEHESVDSGAPSTRRLVSRLPFLPVRSRRDRRAIGVVALAAVVLIVGVGFSLNGTPAHAEHATVLTPLSAGAGAGAGQTTTTTGSPSTPSESPPSAGASQPSTHSKTTTTTKPGAVASPGTSSPTSTASATPSDTPSDSPSDSPSDTPSADPTLPPVDCLQFPLDPSCLVP